ncbi:MAG TPA: acetylglutamate kinase [Vicinamibacterales bacterium]|nr:acetylglutamate kinase [Vicinamibacterales bacterium]
MTTVLKLGGELLDNEAAMKGMAAAIQKLAACEPVVVVHGGGRAIDAELRVRGLEPQFVDGLRVTDAAALETVVSVLAGRTNTAFVAALHAAGARAVGLTGADAGIGLSQKADLFTTTAGERVDLGLVGQPVDAPVTLLQDLIALGYVPVIASVGVSPTGALLNVNADTLAGHLAGALHAGRLIIAGGTAGVLGPSGETLDSLTVDGIDAMIASGEAHSGMVAKLAACRAAITRGVDVVAIVSGRNVADFNQATGTRMHEHDCCND